MTHFDDSYASYVFDYASNSTSSSSGNVTPSSYSSSSLAESMGESSSSSSSQDTVYDDDAERERGPHRVGRVKGRVYEGLRCALTIAARYEGGPSGGAQRDRSVVGERKGKGKARGWSGVELDVAQPWGGMARVIPELQTALKGFKMEEDDPIRRAIGQCSPQIRHVLLMARAAVLSVLVTSTLIPSVQDKMYAKTSLSRSEAKALPAFSKKWDLLLPYLGISDVLKVCSPFQAHSLQIHSLTVLRLKSAKSSSSPHL
jgi:hypothetical protein